jgi:hypothetical protein
MLQRCTVKKSDLAGELQPAISTAWQICGYLLNNGLDYEKNNDL